MLRNDIEDLCLWNVGRQILQEIIDGENKQKPLTDDEIVDMMNDKGYNVARRTIAKYRDQLGIPKSRMRREIL